MDQMFAAVPGFAKLMLEIKSVDQRKEDPPEAYWACSLYIVRAAVADINIRND